MSRSQTCLDYAMARKRRINPTFSHHGIDVQTPHCSYGLKKTLLLGCHGQRCQESIGAGLWLCSFSCGSLSSVHSKRRHGILFMKIPCLPGVRFPFRCNDMGESCLISLQHVLTAVCRGGRWQPWPRLWVRHEALRKGRGVRGPVTSRYGRQCQW